jgi:hypothetical protein
VGGRHGSRGEDTRFVVRASQRDRPSDLSDWRAGLQSG